MSLPTRSTLRMLVCSLALCGIASASHAETFNVTSNADAGTNTLRSAIKQANATPGADRIEFAAGFTATISLESDLPTLIESVEIIGPGADQLTIDGEDAHRIFWVNGDASGGTYAFTGMRLFNAQADIGAAMRIDAATSVTLQQVEVIANEATQQGGGIGALATGPPKTLIIEDSVMRQNLAPDGGALHFFDCEDSLVIRRSAFITNLATKDETGRGGAARVCANMTIQDSVFADNAAVFRGGAIDFALAGDPDMQIVNTTISDNSGGGISLTYRGGPLDTPTLDLRHVTIASNDISASDTALAQHDHGVYRQSSFTELEVSLNNAIIADNTRVDCSPSTTVINSGSHNLDSDNSCNLTAAGDLPATDPMLAGLATDRDTLTRKPLPGSPVIDAASTTLCTDFDQRGIPRPYDGDGDGTAVCDMGAHEISSVIFFDRFES